MFKHFDALHAPDDGGDAAGGAAAGGSPKGDSDKGTPDDGEKLIPESRLRAALKSQADSLTAKFEAKLAEVTAQVREKQADPPKRYTRAELSAAVNAGQITQEKADEMYEAQLREEIRAEARSAAAETVTGDRQKERVVSDVARYKRAAPEILEDGHDTRDRIQEEYNYFLGLGDKPGIATELKAIRAVLGPIDRLEQSRAGTRSAEPHRETGGGGDGGARPKKNSGKLVDTLTAREKEYYEDKIKKGIYAGWDAVENTLKHANPEIRRKHGAAL